MSTARERLESEVLEATLAYEAQAENMAWFHNMTMTFDVLEVLTEMNLLKVSLTVELTATVTARLKELHELLHRGHHNN